MIKKLSLIFIALIIICISGCEKEDTPEDALKDIQIAIAEQDKAKLETRVNISAFLNEIYTECTNELANNIDEFHVKYPNDPFFLHDSKFIKEYNEKMRVIHMKFVNDAVNAYFNKDLAAPEHFKDNPTAYCASEFKHLRAAMHTTIKDVKINGDSASIDFEVKGDSTPYGKFIGELTFRFEFVKYTDNKWHLSHIDNINELIVPLVDKAELVWPD